MNSHVGTFVFVFMQLNLKLTPGTFSRRGKSLSRYDEMSPFVVSRTAILYWICGGVSWASLFCQRPERLNEQPSVLPAVEVIAPGGSYNPDFFSHQVLLRPELDFDSCLSCLLWVSFSPP